MAKIDPSKPPGYFYVGFITQASLDSMPSPEMRDKWPLNCAMSNTIPFATNAAARKAAERHHLRDITVIKN
jgi:hypothetical protein